MPAVYLAKGNVAQARQSVTAVGKAEVYHRDLLAACTQPQRPQNIDQIARDAETSVMSELDPEQWYRVGALLAYCGQDQPALRLLRNAVQQNYCAYSPLLEDPLLKELRKDTEFNQVLTAASNCQASLKEGH